MAVLDADCVLQFQELKRAEREHAKEKQKLMKDKENGRCISCMFVCPLILRFSQESAIQGQPEQDQVRERS